MHLGVAVFNGLAAVFCMVALVVDIYVGAWAVAALQLALMSLNLYMLYINYNRHKELERRNHDRT